MRHVNFPRESIRAQTPASASAAVWSSDLGCLCRQNEAGVLSNSQPPAPQRAVPVIQDNAQLAPKLLVFFIMLRKLRVNRCTIEIIMASIVPRTAPAFAPARS